MSRLVHSLPVLALAVSAALLPGQGSSQHSSGSSWTFAVSGDSRNCGDYVVPAIAARVKAEGDAFYWHLGDFRRMSAEDEDMLAVEPATGARTLEQYRAVAWDDFLKHQMASFGDFPVFLGRGNHEVGIPNSRELYRAKFASYLSRPEIVAQDEKDKTGAAPKLSPWYHFVRDGVDFITLDNSEKDEFSDAQMTWLRGVLDRDLAPNSGIKAIIAGAHEAMPESLNSNHAMDEATPAGIAAGEKAYRWFADAQAKGKHVYLIASHSHYYSPNIYDSPKWKAEGIVVPGLIIGSAGARRYKLPPTAPVGAKTHIYGYVQAIVHPDGSMEFNLKEIGEDEMTAHKWPELPQATLHECYVGNAE